MSREASNNELKEQMKRFSTRLPKAESDLIQKRLDEGGHSAQAVVGALLLDWALGNLPLSDSIRRTAEARDRLK